MPGWVRGAGSESIYNNAKSGLSTGNCSTRLTTLLSRLGPHPRPHSVLKASTTTTDTSIRGCCRSRNRIRKCGYRALSARRRWSGAPATAIPYLALATFPGADAGDGEAVPGSLQQRKDTSLGRRILGTCSVWLSPKPRRKLRNWDAPSCSVAVSTPSPGPSGCSRRDTTPRRRPRRLARVSVNPESGEETLVLKPARAHRKGLEASRNDIYGRFQSEQDNMQLICGTPRHHNPQDQAHNGDHPARHIRNVASPRACISHEDRMTSIRLAGAGGPACHAQHIAVELDLPGPYERLPGSTSPCPRRSLPDNPCQ